MRALAAGAFGLLIISNAFAETAEVVVHLFPAPDAAAAVQMSGDGIGEIWFAQPSADSIARVSPDGSITERLVATGSRPLAVARGEFAGRIVFTEVGTNRIGLMDDDGAVIEFDIPTPASNPRGVAHSTVIWFTEYDGNRIGRLDVGAATPIVEFPVPTFNAGPLGIAIGPGATSGTKDIWFTEFKANKIGRIDASGAITEYVIPTPDSGPTAIVMGVVAGQEVMFFTESRANKIGRITASGQITEYAIPTPNSGAADIAADGFGGGVWFSERLASKLGWFSGDGDFREFSLPANSRPEGISVDYGAYFFKPASVWYVDGTKRYVGRLSDNHLFAVGAGHGSGWNTDFELSGLGGPATAVRLGYPYTGVCPGICFDTSIVVEVPRNGTVRTSASLVPLSEGDHLYYLTAILPLINDVPETRAWIVDGDDSRVDLPLVDYWTLVTLQPPVVPGGSGSQPFLKFPARRRADVRTELVLAAIETDGGALDVLVEAVTLQGDVLGAMPLELPVNETVVPDRVLSELGVFDDFEGYLRVTRASRSGLMWGVAKIFENDQLTRLLSPGSELDQDCAGGPAHCGTPRTTRVVARDAGAQIRDEGSPRAKPEERRDP